MSRHKPKPIDAPGLTRLERLRRVHGWTLRDIADGAGVARGTVARAMLGHAPNVLMALRIAKFLDLTAEDIWGDEAADLSSEKQALTE